MCCTGFCSSQSPMQKTLWNFQNELFAIIQYPESNKIKRALEKDFHSFVFLCVFFRCSLPRLWTMNLAIFFVWEEESVMLIWLNFRPIFVCALWLVQKGHLSGSTWTMALWGQSNQAIFSLCNRRSLSLGWQHKSEHTHTLRRNSEEKKKKAQTHLRSSFIFFCVVSQWQHVLGPHSYMQWIWKHTNRHCSVQMEMLRNFPPIFCTCTARSDPLQCIEGKKINFFFLRITFESCIYCCCRTFTLLFFFRSSCRYEFVRCFSSSCRSFPIHITKGHPYLSYAFFQNIDFHQFPFFASGKSALFMALCNDDDDDDLMMTSPLQVNEETGERKRITHAKLKWKKSWIGEKKTRKKRSGMNIK